MMQHPAIQEVTKKTSVNPYVELTGGEMTAATRETVNTRLGEMIDRLRNCYSVGYSPTNQDFNGKFRRVQLTLTPEAKKRLGVETTINARQGYYAVTKDEEDVLAIAKAKTPASANEAPANKPVEVETKTPDAATASAESKPEPSAAEKEAARQRATEAFRKIFRPANPYQHLVMLDVRALNKKTGAAVTNLSPEDFVLQDNGAKKQFEHFSYGETPLSIVLMIDSAGNTGYALSALRRTARSWLNKLQPEDEIALMAFRAKSALVQGFTKDRKVIADRLRDFTEDAARLDLGYGQDRVNAVFQAAEQLDKSAHLLHRRIVVVVTDDTEAYAKGAIDIAAQM
ncbi:MAG: VWA domain-containing protein, partial [Blastocatellia bacterium]